MTPPTDYAQTPHAQRNRIAKAQALAVQAAEFGLQPYELTLPRPGFGTLADEGRRERVRKACGMRSKPSDQTWADALVELEVGTRSRPGARECPRCHWAIVTVRTAKGTRLDLDAFAHEHGTVYMRAVPGSEAEAVVVTGSDTPPENTPLFRRHEASCPESQQAAARRRREAPRCTACGEPRDGFLALVEPHYTTHPNCEEGRPR